ncbi:hypothetical protein BC833DRAFT_529515 [Globomyces pollinis-pini]|nr:hypothetical protein BC833DRAFT_529515 [Globomyces pollinis-pini]
MKDFSELSEELACCASRTGGVLTDFVPDHIPPSYAPHALLEPTHLDFSLNYLIEEKTLHAVVVQTFVNNRDNSSPNDASLLSSITLNAVSFFNLSVEGAGVSHYYDGEVLNLNWNTPFASHESRSVKISYSIIEPISGLFFEVPDKHFPNRTTYSITDHESERARYWIPCVDFPAVRTTLSFTIDAPATYTAVANGTLLSETVTGDRKVTKYHLDTPCPSYLICVAVGDFVVVDDESVNGMPIKYLAPKGVSSKDLFDTFSKTPSMVKWMEKKLDYKFPWSKYYQIMTKNIGGAMENISLVTWANGKVVDRFLGGELQMGVDSTNVHEMAHTYFGDLLVIRHFEHVWLKESWATYFSSLWLEDTSSKEEFQYDLFRSADRYIGETKRYMRPIVTRRYKSSWSMFDMHTYPGGSYRLHMLRKHIGDETFWRGVQAYIKKYAKSVVETDDFRMCLEKESGINLVPFFEQWIYSKGYPKLKGTFTYEAKEKYALITLEQTQVNHDAQIPFFQIDVEVQITDKDGNVYSSVVKFQDPLQTKVFTVIKMGLTEPKVVAIDPNQKILYGLEMELSENILIGTASEAKDVPNRIIAYRSLIKKGTYSAMKAVEEFILKESFYGIRNQVAAALADSKTQSAINILAKMVENETEPRAMFFIINACHIRDEQLRESLLKVLKRTDIPYRARYSALAGLGIQRHPEDVDYLMSVAKDNQQLGQYGFIRRGAFLGLGYSRSPVAFKYLLSRLQPGLELEDTRESLNNAIAASAFWQSEQDMKLAIEEIEQLLRDPVMDVRYSAISSLVKIKSKPSLGKIQSSKPSFEARERLYIDKLINTLTAGGKDGLGTVMTLTSELESKIKKLDEQNRAYEARLTELSKSFAALSTTAKPTV